MDALPYDLIPPPTALGLVVLQSDESVEDDMRRLLPPEASLLVSRVPSGAEVTPETLAAMERHLSGAAALFPQGKRFAAMGYGCTSGAAQIGPARVAARLRAGADVTRVTDPVTALIAACAALGVTRLGLVSPYLAEVSGRLRAVLGAQGIATPVFVSFDVPEESRVVRISPHSLMVAAQDVARRTPVQALFLSCTNLRTLEVIDPLEEALGIPVLSSNLVLGWHMAQLAGVAARGPGRLFRPEG
ncbi:Asp/Glu racemase [Salipiger sp. 1_MG-2023]|uniref:maleate cis-trans isomerase family protein n=1 Tax=Salipiger sp. 1_MG-2023 TaxID=3062665 RepID=UPI0026E473BF|nr:Asp/Glu racemase [Salipiger sp. 1_MG-2023]MDO6585552.1 Asp/Glu racemase [Salipiger sp. 1_MG-2023]